MDSTVMTSLNDNRLKLDIQRGKLLGFAERDVAFKRDVVIVKDIGASSNCIDDIVLAYSDTANFVHIYQGVYASNKIIGIREVRLYRDAINAVLGKPKDSVDFFGLDSAIKITRVKKYMEDKDVKDGEIVFFACVVHSI